MLRAISKREQNGLTNRVLKCVGLVVMTGIEWLVVYAIYHVVELQDHTAGALFSGLGLCYIAYTGWNTLLLLATRWIEFATSRN